MHYSLIDVSASLEPRWCRVGSIEGCEGSSSVIAAGEAAATHYPGPEVIARLADDHLGLRLPSRLANPRGLLLVSREAVEALSKRVNLAAHELHPFTLINHKRRVHSRDYIMLNPLEQREITHPTTCFSRFSSTGQIYGCEKWVLAQERLADAPDLLRARDFPRAYFASERFVDAVSALALSNFVFDPVEHC